LLRSRQQRKKTGREERIVTKRDVIDVGLIKFHGGRELVHTKRKAAKRGGPEE